MKLEPQFDCPTLLSDLKTQILASCTKAALAVNRELILLYWFVGKRILEEQKRQGWDVKVIEQLAKDLRLEFPDLQGLSRTNLLYMRHKEYCPDARAEVAWYCRLYRFLKQLNLRMCATGCCTLEPQASGFHHLTTQHLWNDVHVAQTVTDDCSV